MTTASLQCDVCLASTMERYGAPAPAWRDLLRCASCGLVAAADFPRASTGHAAGLPRRPGADVRRAAAVMRLVPRGKILEVGCGSGHLLARLDPSRHQVVGLEWTADLAKEAGDRLSGSGIRGGVLATGIEGSHLPAETFDLVALVGCLDRCASPRILLMEASRLLRDGGYAFIEIPCLSSLTARIRGSRWRPMNDPSTAYFFSPATLQKLAAKCGLGAGTVHRPGLGGWPQPGTLLYVARKTSVSLKMTELSKLVGETGRMTPMGATD